jgi:hypothetical protein
MLIIFVCVYFSPIGNNSCHLCMYLQHANCEGQGRAGQGRAGQGRPLALHSFPITCLCLYQIMAETLCRKVNTHTDTHSSSFVFVWIIN